MTLDKGHRKNLVSSSPLKKDPIHQRETSEPHGSKPFYKGPDHSFTRRSHNGENIENDKLMDELSNQ